MEIRPYTLLQRELSGFIAPERLITDPLRLLAYGTDASFYRLVPQLIAVVESEQEVVGLLAACRRLRIPVTFRAAGTSLSGQAITDSVLVVLGHSWRGYAIAEGGATIRLQPGIIGATANRYLAPFGRKIGPDPASINAAKIGGIAANNASGMCCGTAQNSYQTLAAMRVVLADGAVLDTNDPASVVAFRRSHADLLEGLGSLARETKANQALAARIRHKYRMKNTTGYGINALVDFDDPVDVLIHLMIGSEGTLGFISEITYRTVPEHPNKASALILFNDLKTACTAVSALKSTPVAAVELMDRASLRSVENESGLPAAIKSLGEAGAALLVEVSAPTAANLGGQIETVVAALAGLETAEPVAFSTDPEECARFWHVRKGIFPAIGAIREIGTTVIIEDVAFPVPRLAEATLDLAALMQEHGYREGVIYGHALEGNLHFVFTQDFGTPEEVQRYQRFMEAVCRLVVEKYDGSLKAEHGTGRNMAPYVELEWGRDGYALMRRIKALLDPENLLNPGVIFNDDRQVHLKNLKPMPAADPIVDTCIECGFCEPRCPSHGLTLSPRQRIVGWREIARLERMGGEDKKVAELRSLYDYYGIDTCAGDGLCALACPVGIETGVLMKALRGRALSGTARRTADWAASHFGAVEQSVRVGLWTADRFHALLGPRLMQGMTQGLHRASGKAVPQWLPTMPKAVSFKPGSSAAGVSNGQEKVVYFPSCAARAMGPARGDPVQEALPTVTERLLTKAGFGVIYPRGLDGYCCGQPFESKGIAETADRKSAELEKALLEASQGGELPIVFDTSPCAYRMKRFLGERLRVSDINEFLHDAILPRLEIRKSSEAIAVHPVCSVRKMGLEGKLAKVAEACADRVTVPAEVGCCGWAGDKGFTTPELNQHALRDLKPALPEGCSRGYSTSRTCEIGLSQQGGIPYQSIVYLVDACSQSRARVDAQILR